METQRSWQELPIGVQSFSLEQFSTDDVITHARNLKVKCIEFFHGHINPNATDADIIKLKKSIRKAELYISAYGLYAFNNNHVHNRKMFDFATLADIKNITAEVTDDSFDSLTRLVDDYNIPVAIHTSGPGTRFEKLETLAKALEGKHKLIGACVDTGHILRAGGDPVEWIEELGDRVFVVHLTDVAHKQPLTYNMVLGTGYLDLSALLKVLLKIPRLGSISVGYRASSCARLLDPLEEVGYPLRALSESLSQLVAI